VVCHAALSIITTAYLSFSVALDISLKCSIMPSVFANAPELNPVEQLWLNIKQRYLSNMAFKDLSLFKLGNSSIINQIRRSLSSGNESIDGFVNSKKTNHIYMLEGGSDDSDNLSDNLSNNPNDLHCHLVMS
jgi:hypothetical protein